MELTETKTGRPLPQLDFADSEAVTVTEHDGDTTETKIFNVDDFLAKYDPELSEEDRKAKKPRKKKKEKEEISPKLTLIFANREQFTAEHTEHRKSLSARYHLPTCIWTDVCQRLQGYFGHENGYDGDYIGVNRHVTWFHFEVKFPFYEEGQGAYPTRLSSSYRYRWYKMGFAVFWTLPDQCTVICLNVDDEIRKALVGRLEAADTSIKLNDPYSVQLLIIEPVVQCYDKAVWNLRDQIRKFEKERRGETNLSYTDPDLKFNVLHEILRHALHATETLSVAVTTLSDMCTQQQAFYEETPGWNIPGLTRVKNKRSKEQLAFQLSMLKGLEARSRANEARIRNEITLAYNLVAQRDSQTQMNIAKDARTDSFAMRTIAVVTMAFLPSTFVAAVFSTSFFDFRPQDEEDVSGRFWIFWVVAVLLTVVVVAAWLAWLSWRKRLSLPALWV